MSSEFDFRKEMDRAQGPMTYVVSEEAFKALLELHEEQELPRVLGCARLVVYAEGREIREITNTTRQGDEKPMSIEKPSEAQCLFIQAQQDLVYIEKMVAKYTARLDRKKEVIKALKNQVVFKRKQALGSRFADSLDRVLRAFSDCLISEGVSHTKEQFAARREALDLFKEVDPDDAKEAKSDD